jgi:hypothetical protein
MTSQSPFPNSDYSPLSASAIAAGWRMPGTEVVIAAEYGEYVSAWMRPIRKPKHPQPPTTSPQAPNRRTTTNRATAETTAAAGRAAPAEQTSTNRAARADTMASQATPNRRARADKAAGQPAANTAARADKAAGQAAANRAAPTDYATGDPTSPNLADPFAVVPGHPRLVPLSAALAIAAANLKPTPTTIIGDPILRPLDPHAYQPAEQPPAPRHWTGHRISAEEGDGP